MIQTEKFLTVAGPDLSKLEEQAVVQVLRSGWMGNGQIADQFEDEFLKSLGVKNIYALAVNSCTIGLVLALRAEMVGPGDEVITTPLTFSATVNAILMVGAKPVFVDVTEDGLINPYRIKEAITTRTRAIIPVHLHGAPCDMNRIMQIARKHRLVVIEDAAHAFGGTYNNVPLGTIGHYGVFSFYPTKNITTGDGGMILTRNIQKISFLRVMASQGLTADAWMRYGSGPIKNYKVQAEGLKGLMPDMNASIGLAQLSRWPEMKKRRKDVFEVYEKAFGVKPKGHSRHIYSIQVPSRDNFRKRLHERGIGTGLHYNPLHLEPAYEFRLKMVSLPLAERIGRETVSLPLSSAMTIDDANRVVKAVNQIQGESNGI